MVLNLIKHTLNNSVSNKDALQGQRYQRNISCLCTYRQPRPLLQHGPTHPLRNCSANDYCRLVHLIGVLDCNLDPLRRGHVQAREQPPGLLAVLLLRCIHTQQGYIASSHH